jgi:hypothetical protein
MLLSRASKRVIVVLTCLCMLSQAPLLAAGLGVDEASATGASLEIADIALADGGVLTGQVLDKEGSAVTNAVVSVRYRGHEVARAVTDQRGFYTVSSLRGGVHQVVCGTSETLCRLWSPATAPPRAETCAMTVTGGEVVRGNIVDGFNVVSATALGIGIGAMVVAIDNNSGISDIKERLSGS